MLLQLQLRRPTLRLSLPLLRMPRITHRRHTRALIRRRPPNPLPFRRRRLRPRQRLMLLARRRTIPLIPLLRVSLSLLSLLLLRPARSLLLLHTRRTSSCVPLHLLLTLTRTRSQPPRRRTNNPTPCARHIQNPVLISHSQRRPILLRQPQLHLQRRNSRMRDPHNILIHRVFLALALRLTLLALASSKLALGRPLALVLRRPSERPTPTWRPPRRRLTRDEQRTSMMHHPAPRRIRPTRWSPPLPLLPPLLAIPRRRRPAWPSWLAWLSLLL
ncbi:hypothetical protein B0H34DRAFT_702977 [Crassisporium funariophilum]|nr:hypothetical protein B0H34DRAFT_702977 [Crassisporium funariophilum]